MKSVQKNGYSRTVDHKEQNWLLEQKKQHGSDFSCRLKYLNTLPPVPVDAKLLTLPLLPNRFVHYRLTSLEKNYIHDIPFNPREIMELDLIDWQKYHDAESTITSIDNPTRDHSTLSELDREISTAVPIPNISTQSTSLEISPAVESLPTPNRPVVTWLRKSGTQLMKEKKDEYKTDKKKRTISVKPMTVKKAVETIDRSFSEASDLKNSSQLVHPTYSNLTAKRCIPVYPDGCCWNREFALLVFDNMPLDEDDRGIIKTNVSGFEGTGMNLYGTSKNQPVQMDDNQSMKTFIRQYSHVTRRYGEETKFFRLSVENDKASYTPLPVKTTLRRKAQQPSDVNNIPLLLVTRRSLNESELETKNNGLLNIAAGTP